jgi:hypothetical protein
MLSTLGYQRNERFDMPITVTTSDGVAINSFEQFQAVVEKAQELKDIKKAAQREKSDCVTYNGHSIQVRHRNALEAQIPCVLDDMRTCSWNGEIYHEGKFEKKFANYLNFLLAWLKSIRLSTLDFLLVWLRSIWSAASQDTDTIRVSITASQIRNVVNWVYLMMRRYESEFSEDDFVCVERMIDSF